MDEQLKIVKTKPFPACSNSLLLLASLTLKKSLEVRVGRSPSIHLSFWTASG